MVDTALLMRAILATAILIFRMIAREGTFGWKMQNYVFESRHPKAFFIVAVLFWAAWARTADM